MHSSFYRCLHLMPPLAVYLNHLISIWLSCTCRCVLCGSEKKQSQCFQLWFITLRFYMLDQFWVCEMESGELKRISPKPENLTTLHFPLSNLPEPLLSCQSRDFLKKKFFLQSNDQLLFYIPLLLGLSQYYVLHYVMNTNIFICLCSPVLSTNNFTPLVQVSSQCKELKSSIVHSRLHSSELQGDMCIREYKFGIRKTVVLKAKIKSDVSYVYLVT